MDRRAAWTLGIGVFLMLFGVVFAAWSRSESQQLDRHFEELRARGDEVTGFVRSMRCSPRFFKSCTIDEVYDYQGRSHSVRLIEDYSDQLKRRTRETLFVSPTDPGDVVSQRGVPMREAWKMMVLVGPILVGIGAVMLLVLVVGGRHSRRSRNFFEAIAVP